MKVSTQETEFAKELIEKFYAHNIPCYKYIQNQKHPCGRNGRTPQWKCLEKPSISL